MEPATCNYLIRLTPLTPYFFGSEKTLSGDNGATNYFARSNKLPQQSAILGLLRYQLLKAKGLLPITTENREEVNKLIGPKSFAITDSKFNFGAIERLSPVFITDEAGRFYTHLPLDWDFSIEINESEKSYVSGQLHEKTVCSAKFNNKTPWNNGRWIATDPGTTECKWIPEGDIFRTMTKVGITKDRSDGDDEKFFKIEYCMLQKEYAFACFVQLNESIENDLVYLGAERSVFRMEVVPIAENDAKSPKYPDFSQTLFSKSTGQIILLSDSLVPKDVAEQSIFIVGDTIPFRNIQTSIKTKNYYDRNKEGFSKSGLYNLLMRGSVIFCDEANMGEIVGRITANPNLQQAGYNHVVIRKQTK